MNSKQRYFLKKEDRLKSGKDIDLLFSKGRNISVHPLKLVWMMSEHEKLRAGFAVSSRYFKKATDRNRMKRLMRESWRLQKHKLKSHSGDMIDGIALFLIYTGKDICTYDEIFQKMSDAIKRLIKQTDETA